MGGVFHVKEGMSATSGQLDLQLIASLDRSVGCLDYKSRMGLERPLLAPKPRSNIDPQRGDTCFLVWRE